MEERDIHSVFSLVCPIPIARWLLDTGALIAILSLAERAPLDTTLLILLIN